MPSADSTAGTKSIFSSWIASDSRSLTGAFTGSTVADVADIDFAYKKPTSMIRRLGERAIAVPVRRENGANVIETMKGVRAVAADLNQTLLPAQKLEMIQTYDETGYIDSATDLVIQNIYVGGLFAAVILMLFLRSWRPTLIQSLIHI